MRAGGAFLAAVLGDWNGMLWTKTKFICKESVSAGPESLLPSLFLGLARVVAMSGFHSHILILCYL